MKKLLSLLLVLFLFTGQGIVSVKAENTLSPSYSFIDQAQKNGRRVHSSVTFDADEVFFASKHLGTISTFLNNLTFQGIYQKTDDKSSFWSKEMLYGQQDKTTLLGLSSLNFEDDVYLFTSLIPNQALAFTPNEVITFFSTLVNAFSSAVQVSPRVSLLLNNLQTQLNALAKKIGNSPTWKNFISPQSTQDSLFDRLLPLWDDIAAWAQMHQVSDTNLAIVPSAPENAEATQFQFDKKAIEKLFVLLKEWAGNEQNFQGLPSAFLSLSLLSASSAQTYSQHLLEVLEEIESYFVDEAAFPIYLTLFNKGAQLVKVHLPLPFTKDNQEDKKEKEVLYFLFEYDLDLANEQDPAHIVSSTLTDQINQAKLVITVNPLTTKIISSDQVHSFFADISFTSTKEEGEDAVTKGQQLLLSYENTLNKNTSNSQLAAKVSVFNTADGKNGTPSYYNKAGASFLVDQQSSAEGEDAQSLRTFSLDLADDWGEGRVLTIKEEVFTTAPQEVSLPQKVTRLGKMDQLELMIWASQVSTQVVKGLEVILRHLPLSLEP